MDTDTNTTTADTDTPDSIGDFKILYVRHNRTGKVHMTAHLNSHTFLCGTRSTGGHTLVSDEEKDEADARGMRCGRC